MTIITAKRVDGRAVLEISMKSGYDIAELLDEIDLLITANAKAGDAEREALWGDAWDALEAVRAAR